jgi:hypothetical protein
MKSPNKQILLFYIHLQWGSFNEKEYPIRRTQKENHLGYTFLYILEGCHISLNLLPSASILPTFTRHSIGRTQSVLLLGIIRTLHQTK